MYRGIALEGKTLRQIPLGRNPGVGRAGGVWRLGENHFLPLPASRSGRGAQFDLRFRGHISFSDLTLPTFLIQDLREDRGPPGESRIISPSQEP